MESLTNPSKKVMPERRASWRLAALVLTTLFGLEIVYAVNWMSSVPSPGEAFWRHGLRSAAVGALVVMPILLATAAALAPGRLVARLLVSASLCVVPTYAMAVVSSRDNGGRQLSHSDAAFLIVAYLVFLLPAFAWSAYRRWRTDSATPMRGFVGGNSACLNYWQPQVALR